MEGAKGQLWDWSQLAYLLDEDTSSLAGFLKNAVAWEVLAKWAPHLAPEPTLFKYSLVPEVKKKKGKLKHLNSDCPWAVFQCCFVTFLE